MWGQAAKLTIYALYTPIVIQAVAMACDALAREGINKSEEFRKWMFTCNCRICKHRRSLGQNTFH